MPSPTASGRAGVEFGNPADPVFRALYPAIDPVTDMTPVAEPAVAAGRDPARSGRTGCAAGFRIAEPRVASWTAGGESSFVALFLVTTDSPPGVAAPCYHPQPWICVLDKTGDRWAPVDCARVRQDHVFPDEPQVDTAPFRLNAGETAVGARLRHESGNRSEQFTDEILVLFRLHERRLTQVLAVPAAREETDFTDGSTCSRTFVLQVETTQTGGFFDWRVKTGRHTARKRCAVDPDPVGVYRWDGRRYVKR